MKIFTFLLGAFLVSKNRGCYVDDVLGGCEFEPLAIVNPSSGYVITGENCGLEVDKETFHEQPFVFYSEAKDYMKYTLMMVDNDNPLADDDDVFLHWLVTGIDGNSLKYGLGIYSGNTVAAYVPPNPSQNSCVHRYSIFVFEQRFHALELPYIHESREAFNVQAFVENVIPQDGLCSPVASVEFKSRY